MGPHEITMKRGLNRFDSCSAQYVYGVPCGREITGGMARPHGVLLVTTPQTAALQVARRGIVLFQKLQVPVVGLVENMSSVTCAKCQHSTPIFGQGTAKMAAELAYRSLAQKSRAGPHGERVQGGPTSPEPGLPQQLYDGVERSHRVALGAMMMDVVVERGRRRLVILQFHRALASFSRAVVGTFSLYVGITTLLWFVQFNHNLAYGLTPRELGGLLGHGKEEPLVGQLAAPHRAQLFQHLAHGAGGTPATEQQTGRLWGTTNFTSMF
uniref:Uncharacterized protein n=1 Tax=Timema genevievae TaxID=629358 RepID=A0A7R9JQ97_TIMGE|nr:unnamed protein product [Timema genevievae]